ncbi:MAG: FAD-dependent oxidoreductase [Desulfobacterales bacterium]
MIRGGCSKKQPISYHCRSRKNAEVYFFSFAAVGSLFDKLRVLLLSLRLDRQALDSLFSVSDLPTSQYLKRMGFSESMIQGFFQPFFAGVSLDPEIGTSSQIFSYIFKMFASGEAAIPSGGMAAIPRQIAMDLPLDRIGLKMRVDALVPNGVRLSDGRQINAETIVLATEANEVQRLWAPQTIPYRSEKCLYFSADAPPFPHSMLILNGDNIGPIVNLAVPSQVVPEYAPSGKSLIAAIVIEPYGENDEALKNRVKTSFWIGSAVARTHGSI